MEETLPILKSLKDVLLSNIGDLENWSEDLKNKCTLRIILYRGTTQTIAEGLCNSFSNTTFS